MATPPPHTPSLRMYDASAGSGKTYTLVFDYLAIALADPRQTSDAREGWNPQQFTSILALTFTRKATAQMKERILKELTTLATPGAESSMRGALEQTLGLSENALCLRAKTLLISILDQYEALAISTIDSFVQRMAQAVLWELGYPGHLAVSLNLAFFLDRTTEQLLNNLAPREPLFDWMRDYQTEQLDNEKNWRVSHQLSHLGYRLFSSEFLLMEPQEQQRLFSTEFALSTKLSIDSTITQVEHELHQLAQSLDTRRADLGVDPAEFSHGSNGTSGWHAAITPYLNKPPYPEQMLKITKRTLQFLDPENLWVTQKYYKTPEGKALQNVIDIFLRKPFSRYFTILQAHIITLRTLRAVRLELPTLALLSHLRDALTKVERENNAVLLPDIAAILLAMTRPGDAPFIYERLGSRYLHLAIDEFQDTSLVQWALLKPFMENALSFGHSPLLVGDMKQAIYRWRGGNWQLMVDTIPREFQEPFGITGKSLPYNWRSGMNIVAFNNSLFQQMVPMVKQFTQDCAGQFFPYSPTSEKSANILAEELFATLEKGYTNVKQQHPESKQQAPRGFVQWIELAPENATQPTVGELQGGIRVVNPNPFAEPQADSVDNIWANSPTMQTIPETLSLLDRLIYTENVPPSSIAVLTRTNAFAKALIQAIMIHAEHSPLRSPHQTPYAAISPDALRVHSSPEVKTMLAALSHAAGIESDLNSALILQHIQTQLLVDHPDATTAPALGLKQNPQLSRTLRFIQRFAQAPLLEAFDGIAQGLGIPSSPGQAPYIMAMREQIAVFQREQGASIERFARLLNHPEETLGALDLPTQPNSIHVLTFHKAKGLEFPEVICPECNWRMVSRTNEESLWGRLEHNTLQGTYPFNLSLGPRSDFYRETLTEYFNCCVDSLNLLYVAFTRAEQGLHIITRNLTHTKPSSSSTPMLDTDRLFLSSTLPQVAWTQLNTLESGATSYSIGNSTRESTPTTPPKALDSTARTLRMKFPKQAQLTPPKQAIPFATPRASITSLPRETIRLERRTLGEMLHQALIHLPNLERVGQELGKVCLQGTITPLAREGILASLEKTLTGHPYLSILQTPCTLLHEQDIITARGKMVRPDLVIVGEISTLIIDFKFGKQLPAHHQQVQGYLKAFGEMGYPSPVGHLWYIDPDLGTLQVASVELPSSPTVA